jgi:uncharacterized protein
VGGMASSTASVSTNRPARYAKQLAAHLSRRLSTEWDDLSGTGWVELDNGRATLTAQDGVLVMRIELVDGDEELLARFENVLGRHLVKFGRKDELVVDWIRADGTPGTSYRNETDELIGNS